MLMADFIAAFFMGAFLCNSIPHLVSGLRGEKFPTPFARPHGVGESSALVNFLWGSLNLLIAVILHCYSPFFLTANPSLELCALGFFLAGLYTTVHFAKVRRK